MIALSISLLRTSEIATSLTVHSVGISDLDFLAVAFVLTGQLLRKGLVNRGTIFLREQFDNFPTLLLGLLRGTIGMVDLLLRIPRPKRNHIPHLLFAKFLAMPKFYQLHAHRKEPHRQMPRVRLLGLKKSLEGRLIIHVLFPLG